MYQFKNQLILYFLLFISCECKLNLDDNLEDNQIEFYQNINRKMQTTTSKPSRFSIFHKKTRPLFRRNNKYQTSLTDYKLISNASDQQVTNSLKRLNKNKITNEFVDVYDKNRKNNQINNQQFSYDFASDSIENSTKYRNELNNDQSNKIELLTYAQQTVQAFEHGLKMKKEAKCQLPKPTVVYLNQNKDQIKIYMPRATILHRCGQNTGCCESESEQCVAIEKQQVNLYFFVIKLEKEINEFQKNNLASIRRGRKFAKLDQNDDSQLKEYEYNLDYSINEDENAFKSIENTDEEMRLANENSYLVNQLNQDNLLEQRLKRSVSKRKSKDLNLG